MGYQVFVALTVNDQSYKKTNASIYLKLKKLSRKKKIEEKNKKKKNNNINNTRGLSTERGKYLITLFINIENVLFKNVNTTSHFCSLT